MAKRIAPNLLQQLPGERLLLEMVTASWKEYDALVAHEEAWRQTAGAAGEEGRSRRAFHGTARHPLGSRRHVCERNLDTPWRFRSAKALWKYLGIGLDRRHSGNGPELLGVPKQTNRLLKSTILGAARSAIAQGREPVRWPVRGFGFPAACRRRWPSAMWRAVCRRRCGVYEKRHGLPSRVGGVNWPQRKESRRSEVRQRLRCSA